MAKLQLLIVFFRQKCRVKSSAMAAGRKPQKKQRNLCFHSGPTCRPAPLTSPAFKQLLGETIIFLVNGQNAEKLTEAFPQKVTSLPKHAKISPKYDFSSLNKYIWLEMQKFRYKLGIKKLSLIRSNLLVPKSKTHWTKRIFLMCLNEDLLFRYTKYIYRRILYNERQVRSVQKDFFWFLWRTLSFVFTLIA